jgi:hypothetical protein
LNSLYQPIFDNTLLQANGTFIADDMPLFDEGVIAGKIQESLDGANQQDIWVEFDSGIMMSITL